MNGTVYVRKSTRYLVEFLDLSDELQTQIIAEERRELQDDLSDAMIWSVEAFCDYALDEYGVKIDRTSVYVDLPGSVTQFDARFYTHTRVLTDFATNCDYCTDPADVAYIDHLLKQEHIWPFFQSSGRTAYPCIGYHMPDHTQPADKWLILQRFINFLQRFLVDLVEDMRAFVQSDIAYRLSDQGIVEDLTGRDDLYDAITGELYTGDHSDLAPLPEMRGVVGRVCGNTTISIPYEKHKPLR